MQVCKYASMQVCKYVSMRVWEYESMQVCKYTQDMFMKVLGEVSSHCEIFHVDFRYVWFSMIRGHLQGYQVKISTLLDLDDIYIVGKLWNSIFKLAWLQNKIWGRSQGYQVKFSTVEIFFLFHRQKKFDTIRNKLY